MPLVPLNTNQAVPSRFPFTLLINPNTDLWFKPAPLGGNKAPHVAENQPTFYRPIPLRSFLRASCSISFTPKCLFDQSGLVFIFPNHPNRWIKAGIESAEGQAKKSVVVAPGDGRGADWSLSPLSAGDLDDGGKVETVVEFTREDETGSTLVIKIGGEIVREVTWVFGEGQGTSGDEEVWVGIFGARPSKGTTDVMEVKFLSWELDCHK